MKPSTKKQIKSGLRLGGGIGAFWIAAMLASIGMEGLESVAPGHFRLWPDGIVAGGLIALASLILMLTARVWVLYLAGCFLFAVPKVLVVIASGRDFYAPHGPFSRLETAELLFFFLLSLFLMFRISTKHAPAVLDRLALTLYVILFAFSSSGHFSIFSVWPIVGLAALIVAWYFSRKKHGKTQHWGRPA